MRKPNSQWSLRVSTVIVVIACFVVMGSSLLLSQNFRRILTLWGEDVQMTVYLASDLSEQGREDIQKALEETGKVESIRFISQEKALSDFRAELATYAPDLNQDDELLKVIPSSLQVSLASSISVGDQQRTLEHLAGLMQDRQGVDEVSYGQEWVQKYSTLVMAIETTLNVLGLIIVMASLFVLSNAIRASIQSRYEEILVMEMIGATANTIRKPFLTEGATLGLLSSAAALVVCFVIYVGMKSLLVNKLSFLRLGEHVQFLSVSGVILFLIVGTAVGALGSYLCVRRINTGWAAVQG